MEKSNLFEISKVLKYVETPESLWFLNLEDKYRDLRKEIENAFRIPSNRIHSLGDLDYAKFNIDTSQLFVGRIEIAKIKNDQLKHIMHVLSSVQERVFQSLINRIQYSVRKQYLSIRNGCKLINSFIYLCNKWLTGVNQPVIPGFRTQKNDKITIVEKDIFNLICGDCEDDDTIMGALIANQKEEIEFVLVETSTILSVIAAIVNDRHLVYESINYPYLYAEAKGIFILAESEYDALHAKCFGDYRKWCNMMNNPDLKNLLLSVNDKFNSRKFDDTEIDLAVSNCRKIIDKWLDYRRGFEFAMYDSMREIDETMLNTLLNLSN